MNIKEISFNIKPSNDVCEVLFGIIHSDIKEAIIKYAKQYNCIIPNNNTLIMVDFKTNTVDIYLHVNNNDNHVHKLIIDIYSLTYLS